MQGLATTIAGVLAVLAPTFLGLWLGRLVRAALAEKWFRQAVQAFLLLIGLQLVIRGLF